MTPRDVGGLIINHLVHSWVFEIMNRSLFYETLDFEKIRFLKNSLFVMGIE